MKPKLAIQVQRVCTKGAEALKQKGRSELPATHLVAEVAFVFGYAYCLQPGVSLAAAIRCGGLRTADVTFDDAGFEFGGATPAIVVPAYDGGWMIDLVAWDRREPERFARLERRAWALGYSVSGAPDRRGRIATIAARTPIWQSRSSSRRRQRSAGIDMAGPLRQAARARLATEHRRGLCAPLAGPYPTAALSHHGMSARGDAMADHPEIVVFPIALKVTVALADDYVIISQERLFEPDESDIIQVPRAHLRKLIIALEQLLAAEEIRFIALEQLLAAEEIR